MRIEIWSDFQCPFCYMGEKMLEEVLNSAPLTEPVEIVYRAYQLDPDAPFIPKETMTDHFMSGHEMTLAEAEARMAKITERAAKVGLHYNLAGVKVCNTEGAHRLMKFAAERLNPGKLKRLNFLLFKANFEENLLLSDLDVLAGLAEKVGLNREEVLSMLRSDTFKAEVLRDQEEIDARSDFEFVPFMLSSDGSVEQGVVNEECLRRWLHGSMADGATPSEREGCGPGGCSL